ncbi:MAG: queuosine precursor transporter [Muribaculaceae bacterium]|nr:queuosine precursor transporter [Muribaculaceae bacterium]
MKKDISVLFLCLTVLFCVFLILANLMEVKIVDVGFITVTAGLMVFPLSYIINDCIVEVYGFRKARLVIWLGFLVNLIFVLFLQLCILLPCAPQWQMQDAVEAVFGNSFRILLASFIAFLCGSFTNAYVMSKMKLHSGGRHFSFRAIISTLFGESVDSLIFFPIAFWGILPPEVIFSLIWTQAVLKTLYEILVLPLTIKVVKYVKNKEELDVYDTDTNFKWWKINQI